MATNSFSINQDKARRARPPRRRKNARRPSSNHSMTLYGSSRVIEKTRDVTFPESGRMLASSFVKTSAKGNFIDPNPHTWRAIRQSFPSGHFCLDYLDSVNYSHWYQFHPYYSSCFLNIRDLTPYVNTIDSEEAFRKSVRDTCRQIAVKKFLSSLRDSESQFAVDIAEAKKSYSMIHQRLMQIIQMARAVRRKAFAFSRRNPNDPNALPWNQIARLWLEIKYGWLPLVSSAFGVADYLRNKSKNGKFRIKRSHRIETLRFYERVSSLGIRGLTRQRVTTFATYCGDYQVDCAWLNNASRFISLNPLAIAWELVPYSFVADWFVDIGGYLQDYETAVGAGLSFKRGWSTYTHFVEGSHFIPAQVCKNGSRTHLNFDNVQFSSLFRDKSREVLSSTPRPFLPSLDAKLGAQRIVSGAALLMSLLTKFNRKDRYRDTYGESWSKF